jgi:glycosyltransferase involved in cell wall biosynthesis
MAKRKRINLIYRYNDNWMGGTYYIINIVKSLQLLDEDEKPELVILHSPGAPLGLIEEVKYPYLTYREVPLRINNFKRLINKVFYYINGVRVFNLKLDTDLKENVYPLYQDIQGANLNNAYYWIPDFQEEYYPNFFSAEELRAKRMMNKSLVAKGSSIIFSSTNALNDFNKFYPENLNVKRVLNFASFIDEGFRKLDISLLKKKFNIAKPYFIVPNQFWKHKNHMVVLKAIALLKETPLDFQIVFTGKLVDYRNPEYSNQLKQYIIDTEIDKYVLFLGFIDRDEQLKLMSESISIIQPSLFEGWSTVVEDSKVINQVILVSDIPLHREQIDTNATFFDPNDEVDLSQKMELILKSRPLPIPLNYSDFQKKFASDFNNLFS